MPDCNTGERQAGKRRQAIYYSFSRFLKANEYVDRTYQGTIQKHTISSSHTWFMDSGCLNVINPTTSNACIVVGDLLNIFSNKSNRNAFRIAVRAVVDERLNRGGCDDIFAVENHAWCRVYKKQSRRGWGCRRQLRARPD